MELAKLGSEAIAAEQASLKKLLSVCFLKTYGQAVSGELIDEKYESMVTHVRNGSAYVFGALLDGSLLGFLWGYPVDTPSGSVFHIAYIAVLEQGRRKGIGKALLLEAERQAYELGLGRIELIVGADNTSAIQFYDRCGYHSCRYVMRKNVTSLQ